MDKLCDQAGEQKNTTVTCFYLDFAARKEQSATAMLGSLLKQIVSGMEVIPEDISRTFREQKKAIGGRELQLIDIEMMLQDATTSPQRTFVCIDALDECLMEQRVKLLDSLKTILEKSPHTRIFITGRAHIQAEIKAHLAGRVISLLIRPKRDDIIGYIRVRLAQDQTPTAMNESLKKEILEKIPENLSEMYVGAIVPLTFTSQYLLIDIHLGFYWFH